MVSFQGVCSVPAPDAPFTKAIKQGGTGSTALWNLLEHMLLAEVVHEWHTLRSGFELSGCRRLTQVVWAGNFTFTAGIRKDLQHMISTVTGRATKLGLSWTAELLTTSSCDPEPA